MRPTSMASFLALVCWWSSIAVAADVRIAEDRMLVVDGHRLFVLGLYENPGDDAVLDQVAQAGFNTVRASADPASLDRLHAYGLYGWVNVGGRIDFGDARAKREKEMRDMVAACGNHPALLVWEAPDEALWNCWLAGLDGAKTLDEQLRIYREKANTLCRGMVAGYQFLHQLDPAHPLWMNHASGNSNEDLAAFGRGADIVGCDIYPVLPYPTQVFDVSRRDLGMVGTSTHRMQLTAPGKPVWMVLQGCGWVDFDGLFGKKDPNGQRPTYEETRFMAYDAIVRGARAILYWGTHATDKNSQVWRDLLGVIREIADLQPVIAAPDAATQPKVKSGIFFGMLDGGVYALAKEVSGQVWLLVANEHWFPKEYQLSGLDALNGSAYSDSVGHVAATVKNGRLSLAIPAFGVHILKPASKI